MSLGLCNFNKNDTNNSADNKEALSENFADLHEPLSFLQAKAEADRCLYCYDAPCITACPTSIDVPTFIHQIRSGNLIGSAKTILSQNIMGGTCSRACPTEILCEQACVLNSSQEQPVEIGLLQRFAVDSLIAQDIKHPFKRASLKNRRIAVIGAGPAGLACAHRASMLGYDVTVYEAKNKAGGLNEYGLAAYKMADDFAQKEIEFLLQVGGIQIETGQKLGEQLNLKSLCDDFDAVFTSVGLGKTNQLGIEGEDDARVIDAIEFIESIRQADELSSISVGNNVLVIGAGNTAIDAAIQSKRLGAENVTVVYRRGEESMSATQWEIDLARKNGVNFRFYSAPKLFSGTTTETATTNASLECDYMQLNDEGKLTATGKSYQLTTDMVLKAIGQKFDKAPFTELNIENGKLAVSDYQTSMKGLFAGGDCIASGSDLTVQAVEDGKQAAHAMDCYLSNLSGEK